MSLLGIDVGTTGCKVALFSEQGALLASAATEYDARHPQPGWAELDAAAVWDAIRANIRTVTRRTAADPIRAVGASSMGEAAVPVTSDRQILGPSILNFDSRGAEYVDALATGMSNEQLYALNGNTLGNQYSITKLQWIRDQQPELYARADHFLHWSAFVAFMLGAEPCVDYSLANRTLLFDLAAGDWSDALLAWAGLDRAKLPRPVPSATVIGQVSREATDDLGLPAGIPIVAGAHDQCANAVGCGVIRSGSAAVSMGTYVCITPTFAERRAPEVMLARGLSTEHHAVPGQYVSFIYNHGGSIVKWYRNTFAAAEHWQAEAEDRDVYADLFDEVPAEPGSVMVLPHFAQTGPPEFIADSSGVLAGLRLETPRGMILKGIIESVTFYLKEVLDGLDGTGIVIDDYRAVGGGSRSDRWIQTCADILGAPFTRPVVTEAGALGAAIIAGVGCGAFADYADGVAAMVRLDRTFEPDRERHARYMERYEKYRALWPLLKDYLLELNSDRD